MISFTDGFIIDGRMPHPPSFAGTQGAPTTGTPFTYGQAGPPRGYVLYDYVQRIALYGQGCCSWHSAILAAGVVPPPLPVAHASLSDIRTAHGIRLGMSVSEVQHIYGSARTFPSSNVPGVSLLAYHHAIPSMSNSCSQDTTFGFFRNRLVYIGFNDGC